MVKEEHLYILHQGTQAWNEWRKENFEMIPDFREADLRRLRLSGAFLNNTNLRGAQLSGTDLNKAFLSRAVLVGADLSGANLAKAILVEADLSKAIFNRADLRKANLTKAVLVGAVLVGADLSETNLIRTQALETNFSDTTFTGACLENWHINSDTKLEGVICEYVYLKREQQERRPSNPNENFASGEFTTLVRKVLETVDLIFKDGIDWQAFLISFQKLQKEQRIRVEDENEQLPIIRAIENKDDGAFVIRVSVPAKSDKAEFEKSFKREYEHQLKAIEEKYSSQLNAKNNEIISIYRQNSADLLQLAKLAASRPITLETKAVAESESISDRIIQTGNFGIGYMNHGEIKEGAKVAGVINETEQQNLVDAATEIQQLLEQLTDSYPTTTSREKNIVVGEAVEQIENNPTLKIKVINALKAGSIEAFKEAVNHPLINILVATIEGWQ